MTSSTTSCSSGRRVGGADTNGQLTMHRNIIVTRVDMRTRCSEAEHALLTTAVDHYTALKQTDRPELSSFQTLSSWLQRKRVEFWDTQPAYGGSAEIWATLQAACEAEDLDTCMVYLQAAEIKPAKPDLTSFYDSRGFLYEVPKWAVSDPVDWR